MVSSEADLDNETRVARILADRWVHYSQGEAALTRMTELLRGARRTRMPSLLVVGEPDVGKTTILKKFMRGHASVFDPATGQTTSEVVAIEAPGAASIRIVEAKKDIQGNRKEISHDYGEKVQTTLAAGDYVAVTKYEADKADSETPFTVKVGERTEVTVP